MVFADRWRDVNAACAALDADTVFVTPDTCRPFAVEIVDDERLLARFTDSLEERVLRRDQFGVLYDQLESKDVGIGLGSLPAGVEPYVSVFSVLPEYVVDFDTNVFRRAVGEEQQNRTPEDSPLIVESWEARSEPEHVHDDALLLATQLADTPPDETTLTTDLVDLYVLLSDVERGAGALRRSVGERLLDQIGPDGRLDGTYGSVSRATRRYRYLKDESTVLHALEDANIPTEWATGVVPEKLDVVLAATSLDEEKVYDLADRTFVQKTGTHEQEKQGRLAGLQARLDTVDAARRTELQDELEELERKFDDTLAAK
ncbi:hypothetical protein [Haloarchaeobius sp. DFWS5]|uniref:hypothetical protein n=1 Tax=Haloarchaeobius sp. DFWS5 TaxID=3446114 RepID=UPI003EBD1B84